MRSSQITWYPEGDKILQRYMAWWEGQIIDRPPIWIRAIKDRKPAPISTHSNHRQRWLDIDYQLDCFETDLQNWHYLADAIPVFLPNLGPDLCATLFGAQLEFAENTSWSHPIYASCRQILQKKLDFNNLYWQTIERLTHASLERGKDRWITGLTDLHTNGDILAALRGPEALCMEILDDSEGVRLACEYVTNYFSEIYDRLYRPICAAGLPSATWTPSLCAGRMYVVSCDFMALISPAQFHNCILPSIRREMTFLDKRLFHLDGPSALCHLDTLLDLPELQAIQWVYGAGQEPASKWLSVYQKIQATGKSIQVLCDTIQDALLLAEQLKPEGVWWYVYQACSLEQAQFFIQQIEKNCARYRI